jgi:predicted CXXCH cytochrome family protein
VRQIHRALLATVIASLGCHSRQTPHHTAERAGSAYTDARKCNVCHTAIYQQYQRTGMAEAFYRPSVGNTPATTFFHKTSATHYAVLQRDGKFFQRRWQIGYQDREENVDELQIDYIMGSGKHVRTYLHRTSRGTLIELPLAWYAEKGGYWGMNPGYDTAAPDTRRRIGYDCMFCHNSYPEIPAGHQEANSEPVFSGSLPGGIDCQRCHGPGANHVATAQTPGAKVETIRAAILNPARLSADRQMEVCMQCHLETTSRSLPADIKRFDRAPFSYRPSEPLSSFLLYFDNAPGTGREGKFEIVNSAYRLRQSRCYLASGGKLTCELCHNPHDIPRGKAAVQHYDQVCRQCHAAAFDALVAANQHSRDADCITCHMPKRRTEDVVHAVMTDHLIQRRKPSRDLLADFPEHNETEATKYRGEVVPYYDEDALYSAVAQLSQKSNLVAGLPRLASEIEKNHATNVDFYLALGDAWRDSGDPGKAIAPYEEGLKRDPGSVIAMRRLAVALEDSGQFSRLAEVLQRAMQAAPNDPAVWFELGSFDSNQGRNAQAVTELEKAVTLDPDMAEARENLGVALAEIGQTDRAEVAFRDSLRIRPYDARTYANLGKLLAQKNDMPQALYYYEKAIAARPDYASAHFEYGMLLARSNRLDPAQQQMEAALRYDPKLAEAHNLLGGIFEMKQKAAAAAKEYREALRIKPGFARAHLNLGALLAGQRDHAGAVEQLQAAAQSSDKEVAEEARQMLKELQ